MPVLPGYAGSKYHPPMQVHAVTKRLATELVREGCYLAEVEIELIDEDHEWAPYISLEDAKKLDEVRLALRRGKTAARLARAYELKPVPAE
jgi:hypothetical protein